MTARKRRQETPDTGQGAAPSSLADLLRQNGRLGGDQLRAVVDDVLADLDRLHSSGRAHGDVTTDSVVVQGQNYVLSEPSGGRLGNVRYMSPERCQGRTTDARSDIYSLGVVLYEAVTGTVPFESDFRHECMEAHISRPPAPPRLRNPDVSPELERVILRALSKNPAGRYQTAAEFRLAFDAAVGGGLPAQDDTEVSHAIPVATPTESRSERVRRRGVNAWAVVVPVAVLAGAAIAALLLRGAKLTSVRGLPLATAESSLAAIGLQVVVLEDAGDSAPAGRVTHQTPRAGSRVRRGSRVTLTVSRGGGRIPDMSGQDPASAVEWLRSAGAVPAVETAYSDVRAAGLVVATRPGEGDVVVSGMRVAVVVSAGRATCPKCALPRERGARFCTRCGFKL